MKKGSWIREDFAMNKVEGMRGRGLCGRLLLFHPGEGSEGGVSGAQPHLLFLPWGRPVLGLGGLKLLGLRGMMLAGVRVGEL